MKKFVAFFMAAVLCMGLSVTAFAADSPAPAPEPWDILTDEDGEDSDADTTEDETDEIQMYAVYSGSNAKVVSGKGTISLIPDTQEMFDLYELVSTYILWEDISTARESFTKDFTIVAEYIFDVDNPDGGKMVVALGDNAEDYAGQLAFVYHYNGTEWEKMDSYALVDEDGQIAISFDSYSPIYVAVTDLTLDDVADGSTIDVMTTASSSSTDDTAPQTASGSALVVLLVAICTCGGAVVTRKFAVR